MKNDYAFYSRHLNRVFDTLEELEVAEATHFAEVQAKEDKAKAKKADAKKVEDAFKALNAARKEYKEDLVRLTNEYSEQLAHLKGAFEANKKSIHDKLATAEDNYKKELKEFTDKHEQYHLTLKDGDFETTISGSCTKAKDAKKFTANTSDQSGLFNIFDLFFGL